MKKAIIWIIALALSILSLSVSAVYFNSEGRYGNETFGNLINFTTPVAANPCTISGTAPAGIMNCLTDQGARYIYELPNVSTNTGPYSCRWKMRVSTVTDYLPVLNFNQNASNTYITAALRLSGGTINIVAKDTGTLQTTGQTVDNVWYEWTEIFWPNQTVGISINGVEKSVSAVYPATGSDQSGYPTYLQFGVQGIGSYEFNIANLSCGNGTRYADITPVGACSAGSFNKFNIIRWLFCFIRNL